MRIGFVSMMEGCPWGGSEVLWSRAAKMLAQGGNEVTASVRGWRDRPAPIHELAALGCRVFARRPRSWIERAAGRLRFPHDPDWNWIRRSPPELVVISLGIHYEGIAPAAACRAAGVPYTLLIQSADENRWLGDNDLDELRDMYARANACFFVSKRNHALMESMLAIRLPNASVVRNPFNVRYDAAPDWPGVTDKLRLACVAALAPVQKGQDLLFSVLSRAEWRKRPVHLSLYGSGQNSRSLPALARMLDLTSVDFRGYTANVETIWAEHHAMILPSRHEGMPLAMVEAMLCGRMCVTTDVAGNAELIDDGVTGFVAPAPTAEFVGQALERAWIRRDEWRDMGLAAGKAVRERVTSDPVGVFINELKTCLTSKKIT